MNREPATDLLPVEVVFHPSWWHKHAGISFDPDFYFHPGRRVEDERRMEKILFEKFGDLGLGGDRGRDIPWIGNVHNAAGFLLSEMLGCRVEYPEDGPPLVIPAGQPDLDLDVDAAFESPAYRRFIGLVKALKSRFGFVSGDINWGGVLNLALDLRGQAIFLDMADQPDAAAEYFTRIGRVIDRFTRYLQDETGTTSISVNRTVRHLAAPVFLHSECALTMISIAHYRQFIKPLDADWSLHRRPFGIHYCGADPHRFAEEFASLPSLDFLDVGWGGDVKALRSHLPRTFLNIRLSPVEIISWDERAVRREIESRVEASLNPRLTGVCCINMDDRVSDAQVRAVFETVIELRRRFAARN
jgi:hypothetical protein